MRLFKSKIPDVVPRRRERTVEDRQTFEPDQTYRRNRTLTGSRSALFGSAGEHNADMQSPRAEVHNLAEKRRKIGKVLSIVMAATLAIFVLLWFFIGDVSISVDSNVRVTDKDQYERAIGEYFTRQPLERFRFSLDQANLTNYVASQMPEVENVKLSNVTGLATSQFELKMRHPVAQWSIEGVDRFVDADGVSFKTNYYDMPKIQVIDNSGIDPDSAAAVASSRFLSFVGRIVSISSSKGYTLSSVVIPQGTTRQVEARFDGVAYPVRLSVDRPVGEQVEDMARAIVYLQQMGQSPQYIDVRISGRAYYK